MMWASVLRKSLVALSSDDGASRLSGAGNSALSHSSNVGGNPPPSSMISRMRA
jgi:hypothetical protein